MLLEDHINMTLNDMDTTPILKKRYISPIYEEHAVRKKSKFKIQKRNSILETQIVFQIVKESLNRKKKMYL